MRIAFLQNIWHDYMGVMSISGYIKSKGHDARVFIEGGEGDLIGAIRDFSPGILGFPCLTGSHQWALAAADKLKKNFSIPNIFGGIHPTFFPRILEYPQVDMVARGEGEEIVAGVLEAMEGRGSFDAVKGLSFKRNGDIVLRDAGPLISDLDKLPLPDRDLYYRYRMLSQNPTKHFIAGRGCLFNCSFCYNSPEKKLYRSANNVRFRRIEAVLEEISYVKKRYPLKTVVFDDDIFIADRKTLFMSLEEYRKKISLPFICNVRADLLDRDIVSALKRAGCFRVCMGVESGDEDLRYKILKKRIKDKRIIESARLLRDAGIRFLTNNMLGLPGETLEEALKTVKLNIKIKVDYPWCSILQPYPGTEIADYAIKNGYIDTIDPDLFRPTFFEASILKQKDIKEIVNLQKLFYLFVKVPLLLPLAKRLVRLGFLSPVYNLVFLLTFAFRYMRSNRYNIIDMFFIGRDSIHLYLKRKSI